MGGIMREGADEMQQMWKDVIRDMKYTKNPFLELLGDKLWVDYVNYDSHIIIYVKDIEIIEWVV